MVLIERRIRYVIEIVGGCVSEDQRLHHRRDEQAHATASIFQYREQFLARQSGNPQQAAPHGIHARFLRMTARLPRANRPAMPVSASAFGMITGQTSPARNTLCSSAT